MRIYNLLKAPEGLSYDEIDYEAIYQSGYTAGYDSGYTDGGDFCGEFSITPSSLVYPVSGGSKDIDIVVPSSWHIDDSDFEWIYPNFWDEKVGWTGYSAESLNIIEVSKESGTGDKTVHISLPDLQNAPVVFVGTYSVGYLYGHTALITGRTGNLKVTAENDELPFEKTVAIKQTIGYSREFPSSGGTIPIILDFDGSEFRDWQISLAYSFKGTDKPWSAYTLYYSGTTDELPKELELTVPPYTEGLDDYYYVDNEMMLYWSFVFSKPDYEQLFPLRYTITVKKPEVPKLFITHNFPAQEGQYREVPQTGASYTMTISGNCSWTSNTVNYSGSGILCTLSPDSGAANESTTVTVTFPANNDSIQGLVKLGVNPMPVTGYTQDVNYFAWQFRYEAPSATALTFGIYKPCDDSYSESAELYPGLSAITQTIVSPSGAASNLVYTSSNPTVATIDANGIITVTDSGFPVWEEIVFTVTDTISNISASTTGICISVPTVWADGSNDCPCGGLECSCIPATGGTFNFKGYHFTCPDTYITTEWAIVSKPEWVTVSPSSGNMMCGGSGLIDLTVTVAANNSSSLRGGEIVLKENGPDEHQKAIIIEQEGLPQ